MLCERGERENEDRGVLPFDQFDAGNVQNMVYI